MDRKHERREHGIAAQHKPSNATSELAHGKHTLTGGLVPVQRRQAPDGIKATPTSREPDPVARSTMFALFGHGDPTAAAEDPTHVHAVAARGTATGATELPHLEQIQRSFGRHDVSSIRAHVGPDAAASARAMGATAYATGDHVVLGGATDLHTAAHEAAHVVQQRGGVQLKGGVGETGDPYEQHADQVAEAVVRGESAERLLDAHAGARASSGQTRAVQRVFVGSLANDQDEQISSELKRQYSDAPHTDAIAKLRQAPTEYGTLSEIAMALALVSKGTESLDVPNLEEARDHDKGQEDKKAEAEDPTLETGKPRGKHPASEVLTIDFSSEGRRPGRKPTLSTPRERTSKQSGRQPTRGEKVKAKLLAQKSSSYGSAMGATAKDRFPLDQVIKDDTGFRDAVVALVGIGWRDYEIPPQVLEVAEALVKHGVAAKSLTLVEINEAAANEVKGKLENFSPGLQKMVICQDIRTMAADEAHQGVYDRIISTMTIMYPLREYIDMEKEQRHSLGEGTPSGEKASIGGGQEFVANLIGMLKQGGRIYIDTEYTASCMKGFIPPAEVIDMSHDDRGISNSLSYVDKPK